MQVSQVHCKNKVDPLSNYTHVLFVMHTHFLFVMQETANTFANVKWLLQ